jgi:hypothetical protein
VMVNFSCTVFYWGIYLDVDKDEDACSILLYIYLMYSPHYHASSVAFPSMFCNLVACKTQMNCEN